MKKSFWKGISASVIMLGLASLFTDMSSEIIEPILPLLLASLGGGALLIGLIGGLSDAAISLFKVFSGFFSDKIGKRKPLIFTGYAFSSFAKWFFPFITSWQFLIFRPIERMGKGFREPPRDAYLAENTKKKIHGKVFGLHKAFDICGAILGSLMAFFLLWYFKFSFKTILIIAASISIVALIPLIFVKEKARKSRKISFSVNFKGLPPKLRQFLFVAFIFAIANFSTFFLILRANQFFSVSTSVLLYVILNTVFAIFAIPTGILADKVGKKKVLIIGYFILAVTMLSFVFFKSLIALAVLFAFYGLAYAFIIGNERALVADLSSKQLGTSIGTYYMLIGLTALPSSLIAGLLWQFFRPEFAFIFGAIFAFLAAIVFIPMKIKE